MTSYRKYEIRDSEVQEIMRKPPHTFIAQGNIIILFVLGIAFYFLNSIPIYERKTPCFEIVETIPARNQPDSTRTALLLNDGTSIKVNPDQSAKVYINYPHVTPNGYLSGRIDSIGYARQKTPVIYFKAGRSNLALQKGMTGHLEIIIKKKTFFAMLLDRFKL